jgi:molecular chaperone DnaK (HSP70)
MGTSRTFTLGRRAFRAEELSALVLGALKRDAEAMFGEPVTDAVVTVPAYFSDGQRQATRVAAQLAGLNVRRLLNEPTAAALAYGLLEDQDDDAKLVVLDLGGGTFDVSIIEKFEESSRCARRPATLFWAARISSMRSSPNSCAAPALRRRSPAKTALPCARRSGVRPKP